MVERVTRKGTEVTPWHPYVIVRRQTGKTRHHELANGQTAKGLRGQPSFHGHVIKYRVSPVAFWRVMKQWLEHCGVEQSG